MVQIFFQEPQLLICLLNLVIFGWAVITCLNIYYKYHKCNIFFFLEIAYKTCTIQGEWWRHPETNMTWSNYTKCVDFQDLEVSPAPILHAYK